MKRVTLASVLRVCYSFLFFVTVSFAQTNSPQRNFLKDYPKPIVIAVPSKMRELAVAPPQAHFTNFNTEQGLALSSVTSSMVDHLGNIWFGTSGGGVSRFDGTTFTNFTTEQGLAQNVVWYMLEDNIYNIWFSSSEGGVSKYDGKSFTTYTTKDGLADNNVTCMTIDNKGNIWFGTKGAGVSMFDGKSFTNFTINEGLADNNIWSITADKLGNIWMGTDGNGLCKYDGKSFTTFTTNHGLPDNTIFAITFDNTNRLWLGTSYGVSIYDGREFKTFVDSARVLKRSIYSVVFDRNQNIWFGTENKGLVCFNGKQFNVFTEQQGLVNDHVNSVVEDKLGNIWAGTGNGVSRFNGSAVEAYTIIPNQDKENVWSIIEDNDGNLWFGSDENGLYKYNGKTVTNYSLEQGLPSKSISCLTVTKDNNIWIGTNRGGLTCFNGKTFKTYTTKQGLSMNTIWRIVEDKKGNLWIGTGGGGASYFDGVSFTNYTTEQGLPGNDVANIMEDRNGNVWFGTSGEGLSKFDGKKFTNFSTENGLVNNNISKIIEDKSGNIWVSTMSGGVCRYNGKNFIPVTTLNGLASNEVYTMNEYKSELYSASNHNSHFLIFGTNLGYSVFEGWKDKNEHFIPYDSVVNASEVAYLNGVWSYFNYKTGFPIKDLNSSTTCIVKHGFPYGNKSDIGAIWGACGDYKIIKFDPKVIRKQSVKPQVYLQSIKLNNEVVCWYNLKETTDTTVLKQQEMFIYGRQISAEERKKYQKKYAGIVFKDIQPFYPVPNEIELPYKFNNLTLNYFSVETGRSFLVRYQFILEGYSKDWSPITSETFATFGNISEGTYTFKVKACSVDGVWGEPLSYTFTISPPWWRTWYMYFIYILGLIGLVIFIVRWNGSRLRERAKELALEVEKATITIVEQKKVVEEKNKEITDSINYARTIQKAILPTVKQRLGVFKHSFVLFKPKDIVSGDFYWFAEKNGKHIVAACDCTGHGVPGALMSMIGSNLLNQIVNEKGITTPNEILNHLSKQIRETLKQGEGSESRDGMDVAIVAYDASGNADAWVVEYAGSQRPLWIVESQNALIDSGLVDQKMVSTEKHKLLEVKANKISIGGVKAENEIEFTNHVITLSRQATLYLFSDGYADQFSGNEKKLMTSRFKDILLSIQDLNMEEQERYLDGFIKDWMGSREQIDDILVIGVKC